ncbi:glycosyltransferase family 4 protein [Neomicrococcus lactis]|uniref:Glycosyltransferase involved in cell wall biosynthesis n=1 Tax=Neomicrococcus lactis TaxID=732241 RepID=A0A7W8YB01_9MICC|nr:glycosyltransferase family 4 protein [Neomicrococcus lactis]MBB5598224.1 glycosyltransferase involved in cell wall biosynthesis [Neomicrococcus lactis]
MRIRRASPGKNEEYSGFAMKIAIAANNGNMGGGEVMLLAIAREARALGHELVVLAPKEPDELLRVAKDQGFGVESLPSSGRLQYMISLRKWWKENSSDLLWCNGLLPAVATAGMRNRVVHLHQIPSVKLKPFLPLALFRNLRVVVPSAHMQVKIGAAKILPNWSSPIGVREDRDDTDEIIIGFIGRFSSDKGLPNLIKAVNLAQAKISKPLRLVLAGQPRFVDDRDQQIVAEAISSSSVHIQQLGWVAPEDFFSQIDFAVVPSVWQEPFGLVASEAMSARVPVIVSDAGALPDIVGPQYPWVARAGDARSLSEVLLEAIGTPTREKISIVDDSFERWQRLFSPEAGRRSLDSTLKELEGV